MTPDTAALQPGPAIPADEIPRVMRYAAGWDPRITADEAPADLWTRNVVGLGADLVKDIILRYYERSTPQGFDDPKINPKWIRAEAKTRMERAQNLKRLESPPEKRRGGPPPHIANEFAAMKERVGFKSKIERHP